MIAIVTAVNEPTLDLCVWALERNKFDVTVYQDDTTLGSKLAQIYENIDENFLRVDADVIVNRNMTEQHLHNVMPGVWWRQFYTFDWFRQGFYTGGIQYIRRQALPVLRSNINNHVQDERPETSMFRLPEFHNPRRCETYYQMTIMGIHGYGIKDYQYVKDTKKRRNQSGFDWELVKRLNEL